MSRTTGARRAAAALALLATTFGGAVVVVESTSAAADPTTPRPGAEVTAGTGGPLLAEEPGRSATPRKGSRTVLTFAVDGCEGCEVQLQQGRATGKPQRPAVWSSKVRTVADGEVTFTVASRRTFGSTVLVRAPWEGHTGYTTNAVVRYAGKQVGDAVTVEDARAQDNAHACWEGTRSRSLTLPLVVREVEVDGVHERVPGTLAFLGETQSWLDGAKPAPDGVLGSQDVTLCR